MINKLIRNQTIRYIFFGGCTTMVNMVLYVLLTRFTPLSITLANSLAVFLSILFAYVVNKLFVFEHRTNNLRELFEEACKFIGMRLGTMAVDVGGVDLFLFLGMNDLVAKFLLQFLILVLNYLISKFIVFKNKSE